MEKVFDVLVDTGAQVSLVKAGLLPPECLTDSRKPVRLKVANGQYMVGGTKEAAIGLQFVNHRELSRPDLSKEILLQGRFYEAEMDWDMIVGYDFMMETDSGVLPAQASMTLYQDDQLSWLSSPEHHVECQWIHPERDQLEVAALGTEPTGPANQEYGVRPEVASRVVADLGASDLALDAFSSGTSAHLRVCEKYWSAQDSAWKKWLDVAGRQLFEKLRKIHITNPRRNWFEEMWPALKAHHDTPTPGGLSPHQILFGRDPLGRGLPLSGDGMAMDAKEFFARQEQTARDIRQQLEKEHAERQKSAPSSTAQKFRVGDPVWVIRPRPMGTHRTKTWFTPGEVVRRIGEDTYRIKVGHGQFRERHESQLRVREPDLRGQHVSLSYAAHEADLDDDYAGQDDYTVEKILAQRPKASAPGGLEFKVRWRGYGPSHDTWEPVSSFVPRVNTPFMEYIRKHKTKIHVSDLAALTRAIAARGA